MPVIIIGADTEIGRAVVTALLDRQGEVRAFVSEPAVGAELKKLGVKVAIGDVSDASHIGPAALNAHTAVLIAKAAFDERVRSFAGDPEAVIRAWEEALADAGVRRIIWVGASPARERFASLAPEFFEVSIVDRDLVDVARDVAKRDDAA